MNSGAETQRLNIIIALLLKLTKQGEGDGTKPNIGADAVYLRRFDLEYDEIAAILGSSAPSVKELVSRHHRGKKKSPDKANLRKRGR